MQNLTAKQKKHLEATATYSIFDYDENEDVFTISTKLSTERETAHMKVDGSELNDWLENNPSSTSCMHRGLRAINAQINGETDIPHGLVGLHATVDVFLPHERVVRK